MTGIFGRSRASRVSASELQKRIRSLERQVARYGGQASDRGYQMMGDAGNGLASALANIAQRLRGSTSYMGDESMRYVNDAANIGNDALRRLSREVETRPLPTLALAVGLGFLVAILLQRGTKA